MAERLVEVVDPGALTTVQDRGRPGFAHLGVTRSGALDAPARDLANRLVGNMPDVAVLETTLTGVRLRFTSATTVAVTGATCPVWTDDRPVPWGAPITVAAGAVLLVGPADDGLRSYVAVAGGIDVPTVLGSRSTDLLSGLGPAPLRAGDLLPYGEPRAPARAGEPVWSAAAVVRRRERVLHVVWGPRDDWFGEPDRLCGSAYTVAGDSNRVGLRLRGEPLRRSRAGELATEPMVLGAVQVPPDGQPVVFLHDHPTTGGYPVVAVVVADDLAVCAQLRPGESVRLRPVAPRR